MWPVVPPALTPGLSEWRPVLPGEDGLTLLGRPVCASSRMTQSRTQLHTPLTARASRQSSSLGYSRPGLTSSMSP